MEFIQTFFTLKRSNYPLDAIATKKAMLDARVRMVDIARRFDVSQATLSATVAGKTRNLAVQQAISAAVKVPLESLWDMTRPKPRKRSRRSSSTAGERSKTPTASLAASAKKFA